MDTENKKTEHILSLSYGKDSLACLGAIEHLGWPLDRIVTADVWATDEIPAEYPPVVEFKHKVDEYIKERYGITVEHYCATSVDGVKGDKVTYCDAFYHVMQSGKHTGTIKGFPMQRGPWCQKLKLNAIQQSKKMTYEKLFYHVRQSGYREGQIAGFPFVGHPECQKALKIGALRQLDKQFRRQGRNRGFDQQAGKELTQKGISTVVAWAGEWVLWGDHTAAYTYGAEVDPRAIFDVSMRMLMHITNSFQREWSPEIDEPMTRALKDRIINREQEKLDGYVSMGALLGTPTIVFLESENSTTDIMNGDFRWDIAATPTPPLKSASVYVAYTDAGFSVYYEEGGAA